MGKELLNSGKELLLKDLCARLPYGVKCRHESFTSTYTLYAIDFEHSAVNLSPDGLNFDNSWWNNIEQVKPYLFPLASMTEEQKKEYCSLVWFDGLSAGWNKDDAVILNEVNMLIDFYHKNHLDWRGLIQKGLAIDATGLNIY